MQVGWRQAAYRRDSQTDSSDKLEDGDCAGSHHALSEAGELGKVLRPPLLVLFVLVVAVDMHEALR